MKRILLIGIILFLGCATKPQLPDEVILKFESDIPIKVTITKNCEGNWNFCDVDNYNFRKWE